MTNPLTAAQWVTKGPRSCYFLLIDHITIGVLIPSASFIISVQDPFKPWRSEEEEKECQPARWACETGRKRRRRTTVVARDF